MRYSKDDVIPSAAGKWESIISSITNIDAKVFNGKHQACPSCGGKDRFRFDNERDFKGDGGYICSSCGGGDGLDLLCKVSGVPFSEAVNLVGEIVGGHTPEQRIAINQKIAHSSSKEKYGDYLDAEDVVSIMEKCDSRSDSLISRQEGIVVDDMLTLSLRDGVNIVLPLTFANNPDILCGAALIKPGEYVGQFDLEYASKSEPAGAVYRLRKAEGKKDYVVLAESWLDGVHINIATGLEVWVCFTPENMSQVAHRGKMRSLLVSCKPDNIEILHVADDAGIGVLLPVNSSWNAGVEKVIYKAEDLLK